MKEEIDVWDWLYVCSQTTNLTRIKFHKSAKSKPRIKVLLDHGYKFVIHDESHCLMMLKDCDAVEKISLGQDTKWVLDDTEELIITEAINQLIAKHYRKEILKNI